MCQQSHVATKGFKGYPSLPFQLLVALGNLQHSLGSTHVPPISASVLTSPLVLDALALCSAAAYRESMC